MLRDFKYALRLLRSRLGFSTAAITSLALGIGACTAIFSVVDGVLLRSLPYPEAERIVQLREVSEKGALMPVTEPNFRDVRENNDSLEAIAQFTGGLTTVTGGSEAVRARVYYVSNGFFNVLRTEPAYGRAFLPEESQLGGRPVAVVSYGFWKRFLGGKTDFENIALNADDQSFTVVGVMPAGFSFPKDTDVWIPRELFPQQTSRTAHNWSAIGRIRSGISLERASADVS